MRTRGRHAARNHTRAKYITGFCVLGFVVTALYPYLR